MSTPIQLRSELHCPNCGATKLVTMPTDRCMIRATCPQCQMTMRPLPGDCCVFCSYGSVRCPPEQTSQAEDDKDAGG